ncbi:MAG: hypothetical protein AAFQ41_02290 [Cyanobacteria bacterium J06623_7]
MHNNIINHYYAILVIPEDTKIELSENAVWHDVPKENKSCIGMMKYLNNIIEKEKEEAKVSEISDLSEE